VLPTPTPTLPLKGRESSLLLLNSVKGETNNTLNSAYFLAGQNTTLAPGISLPWAPVPARALLPLSYRFGLANSPPTTPGIPPPDPPSAHSPSPSRGGSGWGWGDRLPVGMKRAANCETEGALKATHHSKAPRPAYRRFLRASSGTGGAAGWSVQTRRAKKVTWQLRLPLCCLENTGRIWEILALRSSYSPELR